NGNKYKNILQRHMVSSLIKLNGLNDGLLLKDNAPIHKSKICTNYLKNKKINVIEFSPNSPDLNPIENLWNHLDILCKERHCTNATRLFEVIKNGWNCISKKYMETLVKSIPQRIKEIIKQK